ncbi:MAG: hypothetical protein GF307_04095 [candidate division Zixibacteria bacterium]|nr:hypothetical protein [candidate division Zixibacteria bacterium]
MCLELILIPAFFVFLTVTCRNTGLFITVILLGTLGLTGATTIIAAIISKASMKGALFAVLSFPVLLPVLISAIGGTETAFEGGSFADAMGNLKMLIAYPVIMITVSIFLFEYIWND